MRPLLRKIRKDSGAQILEFAVALPLLVIFLVGIYDFSQAFNTKEKLTFAAKDGARLGATQPTNDLSNAIPLSVVAIRDLVDADLLAAGISDCGLGPITASTPMVWIATGTCANSRTLTLTIDRGFSFSTVVAGAPEPVQIICTRVDIAYPYQWHFNSAIRLLVPSSTFAAITLIDTAEVATNQE